MLVVTGRRRSGSVLGWLFRNRTTGRVTVVQFPNAALGLFLAVSLARRLAGPKGWIATPLDVVAFVALCWWAIDEVARGVNPWRRLLGGVVLAATLVGRLI